MVDLLQEAGRRTRQPEIAVKMKTAGYGMSSAWQT
jgi:hypothetical protein